MNLRNACARDFINAYYQHYPSGVYWYDVSDELILETSQVKVVTAMRFVSTPLQY